MTRLIYQGTDFLSCYDWFPLGNGPSDVWKFTEFCVHVWSLFRCQLAFTADGGATPKNMCSNAPTALSLLISGQLIYVETLRLNRRYKTVCNLSSRNLFIWPQICHLSSLIYCPECNQILVNILCFKLCFKSLCLWFKCGVWLQKNGWFKASYPVTTNCYFLDGKQTS